MATNQETDRNVEEVDQTSPAVPEDAANGRSEQRERKRKRRPVVTLEQVRDLFAVCGRCSFFLAGYKVLASEQELQAAAAKSGGKWLELEWTEAMRTLVQKSYGSQLDVEWYHYEGCCKECQRRYVFSEGRRAGDPELFRIEIAAQPTTVT